MQRLFLRHYRNLVQGLWFRPVLVTLLHGALAIAVVALDHGLVEPIVFKGSADTARAVLTTIAGSSFTAVSIAFTITIVTLQLVSDQFTPRALRGFLGRPLVQMVAGVFVGLVLYCLVVLGLMPDVTERDNYGLPVTVGVLLAIGALFLLLVFIHRISTSIHVSNIVADVARGTADALERHFAEGEPGPAESLEVTEPIEVIVAERSGYVQSIDLDALAGIAERAGVTLRLAVQSGDFIVAGRPVARSSGPLSDEARRRVVGACVCQSQRDLHMDPAFGLRQLADIGAKALSPGINDPTTAVQCLRWMSAVLTPVVRAPRPPARRVAAGEGVVIMPLRGVAELLDESFEEIALYGAASPRICREVRAALDVLDEAVHADHRPALDALRRRVQRFDGPTLTPPG